MPPKCLFWRSLRQDAICIRGTEAHGRRGRFRSVLDTREHEQERWYAFRDARLRPQILERPAEEEIEPRLETD